MLCAWILIFELFLSQLDGLIARNWKSQASKLGSFLDPMADKMLVGSLVVSLTYCGLMPIWLSAMVILRDISLITAGFVIRYISLPPPVSVIIILLASRRIRFDFTLHRFSQRTIMRYFDATHVTAKLKPTLTSKVNTGVQLVCIAASLGAPMYGYVGKCQMDSLHLPLDDWLQTKYSPHFSDHSLLHSLWYFTGFTTVAAALSYILSKDTYKIIKESKRKSSSWFVDATCSRNTLVCPLPSESQSLMIKSIFLFFLIEFSLMKSKILYHFVAILFYVYLFEKQKLYWIL